MTGWAPTVTLRMAASLMIGWGVVGCATDRKSAERNSSESPDYLYVWATARDTILSAPVDGDTTANRNARGVVLLTIDLRGNSPTEGRVIGALLVDSAGRSAHHTEHSLATDGLLFANDFGTGLTHRFDLNVADAPKYQGSFSTAGPFAYPHSFARIPGGNVLATYQWQGYRQPPGGLAELRRDGSVVRWAHAATPGIAAEQLQPYSVEPVIALDRVVTTSTSMVDDAGVHVQIWRLSDLTLLHTIEVPPSPDHVGHAAVNEDSSHAHVKEHHRLPGEPRLLADGRTVMLGTFTCGLYVLSDIDGDAPRLEFVHAFPGADCGVPARIGSFWLQTVPALRAIVVLDVSDPTDRARCLAPCWSSRQTRTGSRMIRRVRGW